MALKGKFVYQHWVKTGTQEVSFMIPDDINETDPNYENRGKEITVTRDKGEWKDNPDQTFEDHVLVIQSCGIHNERPRSDHKIWNVAVIYAIYKSDDDRKNGKPPVFQADFTDWSGFNFNDLKNAGDVYEFCYNYMKANKDFVRESQDI